MDKKVLFKKIFSPIVRFARFFKTFLFKPGGVGAIAPSSEGLADAMVEWIDWDKVDAIVEYGPGTGAFCKQIQESLSEEAVYFAIEKEASLIKVLSQRFPSLKVYEESVENVRALCGKEGVSQVDAIISGLPWANFSFELQVALMQATKDVLREGGQFVTFAYVHGQNLPSGKRFYNLLNETFSKVEKSEVVWGNLPPAFVYRCRL